MNLAALRHFLWPTTLILSTLVTSAPRAGAATPTVIYSTSFETSEGYSTSLTLAGQQNWIGFGTGGNGLLTNFFTGMGQQAYIGFGAPAATNDFLNVWRPVNLAPIPVNQPVVQFAVTMAVVSSSNGRHDDFRWSVYNTNQDRLFTLDFDASVLAITYLLDDGLGFTATGWSFARDTIYDLVITLNFPRNRWSAALNGTQIAGPLPITTTNAPLNLGDIDAVWAIRTLGSPGNNYLVFDDYKISVEAATTNATFSSVTRATNGPAQLRLQGEQVMRYAFDASTNLTNWLTLGTNSAGSGVVDFTDVNATPLDRRFYRARRLVP